MGDTRRAVQNALRAADVPLPTRTISGALNLSHCETLDALKALELRGIAKRTSLPRSPITKASKFAWEYVR